MWKLAAAAIAASTVACTPGCATAESIRCPESIRVDQTLSSKPEGWTESQAGPPPRLAGATFYDGPPEEGAALAPDETRDPQGGRYESVWRLDRNSTRGVWIACEYSATSVVLSRKLPSVSSCRILFDVSATIAGRPVIRAIDCE